MGKRIMAVIAAVLLVFAAGCRKDKDKTPPTEEVSVTQSFQKSIRGIERMAELPENYRYMDYASIAREQDGILYDFLNDERYVPMSPDFTPIGYWDDVTKASASGRTFGLPSYIGHRNASGGGSWAPGGQEGITVFGSLLGSTYAGIDKSAQNGYDLIEMAADDFISSEGLVLNRPETVTGESFWYEIFPQILYTRIADRYRGHGLTGQMIRGADLWVNALDNFRDEDGNRSFKFQSYSFAKGRPVYSDSQGRSWSEPPQGAIAYLLACAYRCTDNPVKRSMYLQGMRICMDDLDASNENGYYEVLQDYNPLMAAYMNLYFDKEYDVEKQLNYIFDADSAVRPGFGCITGGGYGGWSFDGLFGSSSGKTSYAFAMNTFHAAGAIAPVAKYDPRFSAAIGKWLLNLTNNSRVFFPNELPASNQSMGGAFKADPNGTIPYEGARAEYEGRSPYAMGDPTVYGWGQTDYGIYGGAMVGTLGALVQKTDVNGILRIDLNATDSWGDQTYPHYLYYNPYGEERTVAMDLAGEYKLLDAVSGKILSERASSGSRVKIASHSALQLILLPVGAEIEERGGRVYADGVLLYKTLPSVTVSTEDKVQNGTLSGSVDFTVSSSEGIAELTVRVNGTEAYCGECARGFDIDTSALPNGSYRFEVEVLDEYGRRDISSVTINALNPIDKSLAVYAPTAEEMAETFSGFIGKGELVPDGFMVTEINPNGNYGSVMGPEFELDFDRDPIIMLNLSRMSNSMDLQMWFSDDAVNQQKYIAANINQTGMGQYVINDGLVRYNGEKAKSGIQRVRLIFQARDGEGSYAVIGEVAVYYRRDTPVRYVLNIKK